MTSIDGGGSQYRQHSFANCPAEMRLFAQWVVWKYIERSGDKPTKVLFSPKHGLSASVTNPQSWATYYEAVATFERGGYASAKLTRFRQHLRRSFGVAFGGPTT